MTWNSETTGAKPRKHVAHSRKENAIQMLVQQLKQQGLGRNSASNRNFFRVHKNLQIVDLDRKETAEFVNGGQHITIAAGVHIEYLDPNEILLCVHVSLNQAEQPVLSVDVSPKMMERIIVRIHLNQIEFCCTEMLAVIYFAVPDDCATDR